MMAGSLPVDIILQVSNFLPLSLHRALESHQHLYQVLKIYKLQSLLSLLVPINTTWLPHKHYWLGLQTSHNLQTVPYIYSLSKVNLIVNILQHTMIGL